MALAAVLAAGSWPSAQAVSFQSESGNWSGSWDTTIGYGQAWRVSGLDCRLVAIANGGCGYSPNIDDGDLNYRKNAAFSEALTGTSELALNYRTRAASSCVAPASTTGRSWTTPPVTSSSPMTPRA